MLSKYWRGGKNWAGLPAGAEESRNRAMMRSLCYLSATFWLLAISMLVRGLQRGGRARSQVSMAVPFEGAVPQGSAGLSSEAVGESALSAAEQQQEAEGEAHGRLEKVAGAL